MVILGKEKPAHGGFVIGCDAELSFVFGLANCFANRLANGFKGVPFAPVDVLDKLIHGRSAGQTSIGRTVFQSCPLVGREVPRWRTHILFLHCYLQGSRLVNCKQEIIESDCFTRIVTEPSSSQRFNRANVMP